MAALSFSKLIADVGVFRKKLKNLKAAEPTVGFPWYPYDTLANVNHIKGIVPKDVEHIFTQPIKIADVGAADGDLSFYLESVGYSCDIYDYGPTNMNGLRGAREIKERLASKVNIFDGDIDSELRLKDTYDLIIFLGIIYHLKNPFHALEAFAKSSKYCVISTRTAKYFRDGG